MKTSINYLPWSGTEMLPPIIILAVVFTFLWLLDQLFAPISTIPYGIVGFFGKRGSGKSFAMVTYARRWRRYNPHSPVWTNLEKLELPGDGPIHLSCDYEQLMGAYGGLVLIDEAGIWLNALNFMDGDNRRIARWIAATRHYKVMLLMTAHDPSHVNKRVRDVVDEFYLMQPFTTLRFFFYRVYGSSTTIGRKKAQDRSGFIPMWPTTMRSYNTDSLKKQADTAGVQLVGKDAQLLPTETRVVKPRGPVGDRPAPVPKAEITVLKSKPKRVVKDEKKDEEIGEAWKEAITSQL